LAAICLLNAPTGSTWAKDGLAKNIATAIERNKGKRYFFKVYVLKSNIK
jgi:hypothetical protein